MKIENQMVDGVVLGELGERLARLRIGQNLTQKALALQAGIGVRTLQRLETGGTATQLRAFLRVCRILGLVERFDLLIPEPVASPIAQLKLRGRERQRASGTARVAEKPGKWTWGKGT